MTKTVQKTKIRSGKEKNLLKLNSVIINLLNSGINNLANIKAAIAAIKHIKTASNKICTISWVLNAPTVFFMPISFALISDLPVVKLT